MTDEGATPEAQCAECGHGLTTHFRGTGTCMHSTDELTWACDCDEFYLTKRSLFWLSFASAEAGFLGVAIIRATDSLSAIDRAWQIGLNPGGEVLAFGPAPAGTWPDDLVEDRLLNKAEAEALQ